MSDPPDDNCDLLCLDLPHAEEIRASLPAADTVEYAAAAARSLGDPTRLTIAAALLRGQETCVCDMAWVVGQPQNLVSHHLRQLKVAGMVTSRRQGRLVIYRLTERGRALAETVMALAATPESGHV
ncbi:ArsR/SmtB family transcription factor [Mycobacterium sp. IDR2000157661]|uniref:ArsR/SmtB family transcription factor n=1 Tax=Mycobacterium sp. IDR2000157661 TaxID=2867005 RepID=UPI001EEBC440|nr:metalloregulator ArsR/SmtB family transcription factor [Mycobacterium sp. IDR2000157661]ULE33757.1 metalloregulator ArsR/SmtB family transcription factor [Mycobacterium sp. IDR2000157661]